MKPMKFAKFLVLALAVTVAVAGCKKTPVKVTEIPGSRGGTEGPGRVASTPQIRDTPPPSTPFRNEAPARTTPNNDFGNLPPSQPVKPLDNAGGSGKPASTEPIPLASPEGFANMIEQPDLLKIQSVYFAFDSSEVRAGEKTKIGPVAEYLKGHANDKIRIYGNCDERGTEEYNRSLGERRALALRAQLLDEGIDSGRIDTVTNGKDKPVALGHDEASWRQNRRGDFVVLVPPAAPVSQ